MVCCVKLFARTARHVFALSSGFLTDNNPPVKDTRHSTSAQKCPQNLIHQIPVHQALAHRRACLLHPLLRPHRVYVAIYSSFHLFGQLGRIDSLSRTAKFAMLEENQEIRRTVALGCCKTGSTRARAKQAGGGGILESNAHRNVATKHVLYKIKLLLSEGEWKRTLA